MEITVYNYMWLFCTPTAVINFVVPWRSDLFKSVQGFEISKTFLIVIWYFMAFLCNHIQVL